VLRGRDERGQGTLHGRFKLAVDIGLGLVDFLDDGALAVRLLLRLRGRQRIGLVCTLGTPGHVVPVAERVHVEDVDVGRHDQQVSGERGEHVPRVHVHERGEEVETEGGSQRDDDDTRTGGREERLEERPDSVTHIEVHRGLSGEGAHDEVHGQDDDVELDDTKDNKGRDIRVFGTVMFFLPSASHPDRGTALSAILPFWTITQSQDELQQKERQVEVFQNGIDDGSSPITEGESSVVVRSARVSDQVHDDSSGKPIRRWMRRLARSSSGTGGRAQWTYREQTRS